MACYKIAKEADHGKAAALLESLRAEKPENWPYGLNPDMFDPGDLFLLHKDASEDPVGFVGWQQREMGGETVGMYSIGVLPQYRRQGVAKEAVSKILTERSKYVDRVAAMVAPGNVPSEKLAASLGVPLLPKKAGLPPGVIGGALKNIGGGALNAAFWDYTMAPQGNQGLHKNWINSDGNFDRTRLGNTFANFLLGLGGTAAARGSVRNFRTDPRVGAELGVLSLAQLGAAPYKDLAIYAPKGIKAMEEVPDAIRGLGGQQKPEGSDKTWPMLLGAGGIAAALGLGAYGISKSMEKNRNAEVGGRLKVTLPTKDPGDSETVLDLPFNQERSLTNALRHRLELDTRRRLYAETKQRIRRRKPPTSAATQTINV